MIERMKLEMERLTKSGETARDLRISDYAYGTISALIGRVADLERQLAEERERREEAEKEVGLWCTGQHVWEGDKQTDATARRALEAERVAHEATRKELAALKQRFDNAPKTTATYWDVHERHQRPYTSLASIWRDPLDLAPGEPCNVRIVKEQP